MKTTDQPRFSKKAVLGMLALAGLGAALVSPATYAEGVFISAPQRTDVAYDDAHGVLFISSGGQLLRYNLSSGTFLAPVNLGGSLLGMDISPDGKTLVVADNTTSNGQVWVDVVNLDTLKYKRVNFPQAFYEGGTYTVAFGADGSLLVSSTFEGSGWVPLRHYDPKTGTATQVASVRQDSMLRASADRSVIGIVEANISSGPIDRFTISDNNFYAGADTWWFNFEVGVSRNGQQFAVPTYGGTFLTDGNLNMLPTVIGQYAGQAPIGVTYHPQKDLVYFAVADTSQVQVYNTSTLQKTDSFEFESTFQWPGNWAFDVGRMKTSKDGSLLFATVDGGVRYVQTSGGGVPPVAVGGKVNVLEDSPTSVYLNATYGHGVVPSYKLTATPKHGRLSGAAPALTYTPAANFHGNDSLSFTVSDGKTTSAPATIALVVGGVNDAPSFVLQSTSFAGGSGGQPIVYHNAITDISPGPKNESAQKVSFVVSVDNPSLFAKQPQISALGTLSFVPYAQKTAKAATVSVYAVDNGGTVNGGQNTSPTQQFTITVGPSN